MHLWRVRLPSGPLIDKWGRGEAGSHNNGIVKLRVRLPSAPLECSVMSVRVGYERHRKV